MKIEYLCSPTTVTYSSEWGKSLTIVTKGQGNINGLSKIRFDSEIQMYILFNEWPNDENTHMVIPPSEVLSIFEYDS